MQNNSPRKLSQILQDAVDELAGNTVTLQQISDQLGARSYGVFIVLMSIPNLIPGISVISGMILLIFSLQMLVGIEKPWLPKFISQFSLKTLTLKKGMDKVLPVLEKFECFIRPRFVFMSSSTAIRCMGGAISFMSLIILLPIPFGNLFPSLALFLMAFGIMQKDGLIVLVSAAFGVIYSSLFLWFVWSVLMRLISII
jgi:hypothetical protein